MLLNRKIIIFILLISPTLFFNYLTLTFLDHNNNLSTFSTIFIISFNFLNIIFGLVYYKKNFKVFLSFLFYCIFLFLFFDFGLEKFINKKSVIKEDSELGWILKPNKEIIFSQITSKGLKYDVAFKTSAVEGFREYEDFKNKNKNILVIGDSYTAGPYTSNEKMYYSIIKNIFIKNNINLNWYVMGSGGYGTTQQLLLLKKYHKKIKPDIILHQFCSNDFFDNSIKIGKLSTAHDQYLRRPYYKNNKIYKVENSFSPVYRFLYRYSFIFKKFDQIYNYKQFRTYGRFTNNIPQKYFEESVLNTKNLFLEIRELVGKETPYFSINCAMKNSKFWDINFLTLEWEKIIKTINGFPLVKPGNILFDLNNRKVDVNNQDGAHLNTYGNKVYGELIALEMIDILKKNEK